MPSQGNNVLIRRNKEGSICSMKNAMVYDGILVSFLPSDKMV